MTPAHERHFNLMSNPSLLQPYTDENLINETAVSSSSFELRGTQTKSAMLAYIRHTRLKYSFAGSDTRLLIIYFYLFIYYISSFKKTDKFNWNNLYYILISHRISSILFHFCTFILSFSFRIQFSYFPLFFL